MCPISDRITCLSHLLFCWSFERKNEQLFFELSSVWVPRGTRVLQFGSDNAGMGRFTYFPGQFQRFLLINPKDRLALLEIDETCSDHFNLLLTVIPRYDAESTCSSLDPQKKYVRWGGLCLFEMQMMLHFEGLNCICHSWCQISSLLRPSWRLSQSEYSTTTPYKRVSSANSLPVEVRLFGRSLMYVRNNNGPSTDPCGTPEVTGEEGDVVSSQMMVWILLVRRDSIQDKRFPWIP